MHYGLLLDPVNGKSGYGPDGSNESLILNDRGLRLQCNWSRCSEDTWKNLWNLRKKDTW